MIIQKVAYTYEEAAQQCGYSVRILRQAVNDELLMARYMGTETVIRHEDLHAWIAQLPTKATGARRLVEGGASHHLVPATKETKPMPSQQEKGDNLPLPEHEGEWLTPEDLARLWQVSPGTVANWRNQRKGPEFVRIGGLVRYRRNAVEAWIESQPSE